MSRRARLSLGPNTPILPSALSDSTPSFKTINKSNRRTSLGGDSPNTTVNNNEEDGAVKKDRKALLDEWRRNRAASASADPSPVKRASSPVTKRYISTAPERSFEDNESTMIAASSSLSGGIIHSSGRYDEKENDGKSALERFRLRKKLQREANGIMETTTAAATPTAPCKSFFDDDDNNTISGGSIINHTPSRRPKSARRSLSAGGAQRKVRRRTSLSPDSRAAELPPPPPERKHGGSKQPMLPPSYPSSEERQDNALLAATSLPPATNVASTIITSQPNNNELQQATVQQQLPQFSQESTDSIDSLAMKSRISAMQRRIDSLERDKMELSMSKAPLEARIRQKEDAFLKERERLLSEIETLTRQSREVDERNRELQMENEGLGEMIKKMNREANEANFTKNWEGGGGDEEADAWNERLKSNKEIAVLRSELKDKDYAIKILRSEKISLEAEVHGFKVEIGTLEKNYDELERDYAELEASKSKNSEAEIQLEVLAQEMVATTAQLNATSADFEETKSRAKADLAAKEEVWKKKESDLLFEISVLKSRAGPEFETDAPMGEEDTAVLKARIEARDRRITELEEQLLNGEQLRRALHNRIQELRGNIRVYVRTRPFLPNDGASSSSSIDILPDGESLTIQGNRGEGAHAFKFDKVFAPSSGQEIVFDEVSEFVQSALDGYHVCLFSYGQTGSGKTHTMQGSGNGAMRGIIPRAVEQILAQAEIMQTQRWTFTMKASFLEIYNEELRDLLVMMNSDGTIRSRDTRTATKLSIKRNADGKSFVDGINMVDINVQNKAAGVEQLEAVMAAAARARSVAKTNMNSHSSRSHSVFMLHLCGSNEESGTVVQGALNLCDLAGSERLDRSGAGSNAQRLKETQAINKSLSCLGDVFNALSNGSKHIPFRNSKLTYLLQDCLSGDGKALMFVNLSPTLESSNESLCSLRFAQRVNQVELGKAVKNVQYK